MKLCEIYKTTQPVISLEVFPPESEYDIISLCETLRDLIKYNPKLISLTCGAGGKNNHNYKSTLKHLTETFSVDIMPHFTCIDSSIDFLTQNIHFFNTLNIENIFALRGDIPHNYKRANNQFCYANELIKHLKTHTSFSIAAAGYPEGHFECSDYALNIEHLKQKINSGAELIITQMFFDNEKLYDYIDQIRKAGISIPIIPGIMPIRSINQIKKMLTLAKVTIPQKLKNKHELHQNDKEYIKSLGIEYATTQCQELLDNKIEGLHFFTLNKSDSVQKILDNITIKQ